MTPEAADLSRCSHWACKAEPRWLICSAENGDLNNPLNSAVACRRHLSYVLENNPEAMEGMDACVVYDLRHSDDD